MRYTVHLRDSGLDSAAKAAAEQRYRIRLHHLCGSEAEVVATHSRWQALTESSREALAEADRDFMRHWERVIQECTEEGLSKQSLPIGFAGRFEILAV